MSKATIWEPRASREARRAKFNTLADLENDELLDLFREETEEYFAEFPKRYEDARTELLRRMTVAQESHCRMGIACPLHEGQVHGQEASELRTKLEKYIECIDVVENGSDVVKALQEILDSTDARDSLAFEQKNDRQARREQADKVSLSVEGLDLLLKLRMLEDDNHPTTKSLKEMGLLVSMVNPDGVSLSLLGEQLLEKLKG